MSDKTKKQAINDELFEAAMLLKHSCESRERCIGCKFYSFNRCLIHDYPVYWGINENKN